jgi:serine phosphatase RsbU (regulator of sigma subunit)
VLTFRNFEVLLEPGTALVFYTDGLTEFRHDMLAEEQRLLECAAHIFKNPPADPALRLKEVMLNGNAPRDDIAILTVEIA